MLTLVQIVELLVNVAGKIRACIDETLNTEEQALSCFKVDTHRPKRYFELDNIPWGYLFFFIVWVEWDEGSAPCWVLCAMRGSEDTGWASVL